MVVDICILLQHTLQHSSPIGDCIVAAAGQLNMMILQAATQIEDFPSNFSISLIYYLTTWTIQIFISKGGHFLIGVVSPLKGALCSIV